MPNKLKVVESQELTTTTPELSLPSANLVHSITLTNELQNRHHQFQSGLSALEGEMEGQEQAYQKAAKDTKDKHEESKADLLRRIDDLKKGARMIAAALDVGDEKL